MKRWLNILITAGLVLSAMVGPAFAAEPVLPKVLTLEEVQQMAMARNYGIQTKEQTLVRASEAREQGVDTADALRVSQGDSWVADSYAKAALVNLTAQTNSVAISERKVTLEKESLEFAVRSLCDTLRDTQSQLDVLNKKLVYDQRMANLVGLKLLYGLESDFNAGKAQDDLKQKQALKSQLEKSLETAYVKLNRLIGLEDGDRYTVTYDIPYVLLEDTIPALQYDKDPYLWILDKQKETDEVRLDLYTVSDSLLTQDESYKGRQAKKKITNNAYLDTRDKLGEAVKTRFYQIKQLEDQMGALQVKVSRAQKTLDLAKLQFDVGMGTALDVQGAEVALASAKQEYEKALLSHASLVVIYKKPYLVPDYLSSDYSTALGG